MTDKTDKSGTDSGHVRELSATERLRALLDERGVEWEGETDEDGWAFTRWHGFEDTGWLASSDELCGLLDLRGRYLFTPEQAVAATLGPGTCRWEPADHVTEGEWWNTECGESFTWEPYGTPNFCPGCGKRVVE